MVNTEVPSFPCPFLIFGTTILVQVLEGTRGSVSGKLNGDIKFQVVVRSATKQMIHRVDRKMTYLV